MEIEPWSSRERSDRREKGRVFLKFEEAEGCGEKSKEMGESGVTRIGVVAL